MVRQCVCILALTFVCATQAQQLQEVQLDGTPSVYFDQGGKVNACALRLFGVDAVPGPQGLFRSVDVSVLIPLDAVEKGVGMVKAASVEATLASVQQGSPPRVLRVLDGWVRIPGSDRTTPFQGRVLKSDESPNAHLYLAKFDALMEIVNAVIEGTQIQLSVKREGFVTHPVYYGTVTMKTEDKKQLVSCFGDLLSRMEQKVR